MKTFACCKRSLDDFTTEELERELCNRRLNDQIDKAIDFVQRNRNEITGITHESSRNGLGRTITIEIHGGA